MRGVYAFSVAIALVLLFLLAFRAWYSESTFASSAVTSYVSAQHAAFLRHDLEYTLRQALYFGSECYVASGFTDLSCYQRYLSAWAEGWAREGVRISGEFNVSPFVDGNLLSSTLSAALRYSGPISGSIPAGFGVISRIGG